ncbi:MAG: O-antigen ligase family protein, partial [Candidatus Magasanikbacteria bacterium]|nr:O-antigen ligase family protein [Candidatus Magasanikbacteria bacterium]
VWNFAKKSFVNSHLLSNSLLTISVISAVFGWVQFFAFPDIKPFFVYGWDMHLFRLVGTFLDPTFLGLIIVFGLLLSINRFIDSREKKYLLIILFLLMSLAFTYSRASYLAFLGGIFVIAFAEKKFRKMMVLAAALLVFALLLPTAKNHSIELTRSFSVIARLDNYKDTIEVFKKFPVFGVGFNNLCIARNKYIGLESFASHACSGSDSSLLLILATTGTVGLMVFAGSILGVFKSLPKGREAQPPIAVFVALFVHSLFSNSLFFPWVMGYIVVLLAVSLKE